MTGGKKWLLVITDEQHAWIKDVIRDTGLKGSDIVREVLDRVMGEDDKKFRQSLSQAQLKIKLESINDRRAALEEEAAKLKKQLSGERVAV